MAVATRKSLASLMQKTLERRAAVARVNLQFKKNQIEQILFGYIQNGTLGPYSELLKVLKGYQLNDDNYRILFEDSLSCVVYLGKDMKQFVEAVCNVEWVNRTEDLVELFSRFVLNLLTAHTYHCTRVMACLVKLFKAEGENWDTSLPDSVITKWSNIHTMIAQIVAAIPMASDILMQIVVDQFPYYKAGCYLNRAYVHNLIWISKYIPSLTEQIILAIVNRMIIMDVNLVDRAKNKLQSDGVFDMDLEEQDELSQALDYCMVEVLRWLEEERDPAFHILCNVFDRSILPTHGIRHVQFLLVYTISISQVCADRVLGHLWTMAAGLHGHTGPAAPNTRRTAATHLAGILARCVRIPNSRLIQYLRSMSEWCHSYITATQESTTASDNAKVHGAFHAICHAIFYLVAFKHHHLFQSKGSINFVESLNLPRLVTCNLNPLRTCPPQVTRAFASVTRSHQLVYCQAIIDRNTRHTLHANSVQEYDEWFPYDPYTLPMSGKIIWPLCVEYKDWPKHGDDETQFSNMSKKFEIEEDDFLMASPSQKFATSLSNCISPGFKTSESALG